MRTLLGRLLFTLSLVAGADLVLFLALDSGALGDAALHEVGPRGSATDVGFARWRLGHYRDFRSQALRLRLDGPDGARELQLHGEDGQLFLRDGTEEVARLEMQQDLGALATQLASTSSPAWKLQAFVPEEQRSLPASGIAAALQGLPLTLPSGVQVDAPWADVAPGWSRFLDGFVSLLTFDFGLDRQGRPVWERIRDRGGRSLLLAVPAFLLGTLCALALSLWAGARPKADRRLQVLAILVLSVSSIVWLLFLRHLFAVQLGWFPLRPWSEPVLPLLLLPILLWAWLSTWPDFLLYRTLVRERSRSTWMVAARARGLSSTRLWWRHMLPSLVAPLASLLVVTLPFLVLGSLLLETLFDIPGLGNALVDAVSAHDVNLLRALTFLIALAYLAAQWCGEVVALRADSRLEEHRA